ncbi:Nitrilase/cyanide hydratase and apolipoprotein N- acyltransferase [Desulfofarcimen acetoxidans DSM 771]|uniref:Nitrilase/cyanide hydratase and apolipoprotein N-acyltransferase n=1 Tax=Desulfofarcimen acetoxidans (strain ATCC 49208 / DSM 771 / KCTC 5769 / VKM B-1644 / 5575) TaxID=485916 RepID=C8VYD7_DESAS|nr:carbon-nitrogen hydrolase family protein [Desulfofarcimen acetoxidans]ACV62818.1 Nitrilase/cyanide hydratase and apolipoprotein N- acyltransferase [Desulfofarcimen acetoxidans DSM 771]
MGGKFQEENADQEVKFALIHPALEWKNKENNIQKLMILNEKAASEGARIILNTEMAATGYSFAGSSEIAPLTEVIPGPTTERFGSIARKYHCYICIGLPEVDPGVGSLYNSAALIGPDGEVIGKYRKVFPAFKENLWARKGNLPILVAETEYGKLGVIICADAYSYKPPRIAALKGARLLLILANWPPHHHNPQDIWRARAVENGIYILVCNRTGKDKTMNYIFAESFIIDNKGKIITRMQSAEDTIIYGTVPLVKGTFISSADFILGQRQPELYGKISLDTFSQPVPEALLSLPEPKLFGVATVQFRPVAEKVEENRQKMLELIDRATAVAAQKGIELNLILFPELAATGAISDARKIQELAEEIPGAGTAVFTEKAGENNVYIVLGIVEKQGVDYFNTAVLIGAEGMLGKYRKVHLTSQDKTWACAGKEGFPTFDLPFGRVAILIGYDLIFPESVECLAKWGTDLLCVPSLWGDEKSKFIWEARITEQMHLAIANQWGDSGDYQSLGESLIYSYSSYPEKRIRRKSPAAGDMINILTLNSKSTREKRFLENIDYDIILGVTKREKIKT